MSSDEEDIVLDPFIGTGTTAIAAKKLGRRFIGSDIDPKYVDIANKKLEAEEPTMISGCYVSILLDNVITVRDKDWDEIKDAFIIPQDSIELERREIQLLRKKRKTIGRKTAKIMQGSLLPLSEQCQEIPTTT